MQKIYFSGTEFFFYPVFFKKNNYRIYLNSVLLTNTNVGVYLQLGVLII